MSSIPYLDNIETTLMKIFAETPEISGKSGIFFLNRNYLNYLISLNSLMIYCFAYDRILFGYRKKRNWGFSFNFLRNIRTRKGVSYA